MLSTSGGMRTRSTHTHLKTWNQPPEMRRALLYSTEQHEKFKKRKKERKSNCECNRNGETAHTLNVEWNKCSVYFSGTFTVAGLIVLTSTRGSVPTVTHLGRWKKNICCSHVGTANIKWPLQFPVGLLGEVFELLEQGFQMSSVVTSCQSKEHRKNGLKGHFQLPANGSTCTIYEW